MRPGVPAGRALATVLAGAVVCSGCSGDGDADQQNVPMEDARPAISGAYDRSGPSAETSRFSGQVSPLNANVSDLNVRVTDMGTVIDLPSDALFEFDKADLTPNAEAELRKAAAMIVQAPAGTIQIIGHTDSKGDDAYNQRLSEARAQTVADWFGQQVGVRQREFAVSGRGKTAPIAPNQTASGADDPAGRSKNRRVEVILPNP